MTIFSNLFHGVLITRSNQRRSNLPLSPLKAVYSRCIKRRYNGGGRRTPDAPPW